MKEIGELLLKLLKVFIEWWLENRGKDKNQAISAAAIKFDIPESRVRELIKQSESISVSDSDRDIIATNPDGSYKSWYQTFYNKNEEKRPEQGYVSWYQTFYKKQF